MHALGLGLPISDTVDKDTLYECCAVQQVPTALLIAPISERTPSVCASPIARDPRALCIPSFGMWRGGAARINKVCQKTNMEKRKYQEPHPESNAYVVCLTSDGFERCQLSHHNPAVHKDLTLLFAVLFPALSAQQLRIPEDVERLFLYVTVPQKISSNESEDSEKQMHCHYQGYVANFPSSAVTLSICSGLRVSSGIKIFSNCSMHDYRYFVSKFETQCLQSFSKLKPLYQNQSVCGNGILEPHEECDCGSEEVSN
ncbi:hypothetical protein CB1_000667002 [Camelus ferus]|nr:hypothetical protein CB1_000667002 [Camelus ferus]